VGIKLGTIDIVVFATPEKLLNHLTKITDKNLRPNDEKRNTIHLNDLAIGNKFPQPSKHVMLCHHNF